MNLDRVTITGADDTIYPSDLEKLSQKYPYVEWGILISGKMTGTPRFPSFLWQDATRQLAERKKIRTSIHLCGQWLRRLLVGDPEPMVVELSGESERMQLNFHGEPVKECDEKQFHRALEKLGRRQFIFQIDGGDGPKLFQGARASRSPQLDVVPLFDLSHGAGVLPSQWPEPIRDVPYCGYAGGLSPNNLIEQLAKIYVVAKNQRFWIDMESHVRTDGKFDLDKVERVLAMCEAFVKKAA